MASDGGQVGDRMNVVTLSDSVPSAIPNLPTRGVMFTGIVEEIGIIRTADTGRERDNRLVIGCRLASNAARSGKHSPLHVMRNAPGQG